MTAAAKPRPQSRVNARLISAGVALALTAVAALGGCATAGTSVQVNGSGGSTGYAQKAELSQSLEASRGNDAGSGSIDSSAKSGKLVVAPGQTATLRDDPGSYAYTWTGGLELTVRRAEMLDGQDALDYAAQVGLDVPTSMGEPGSLHEDGRLATVDIEIAALEDFSLDQESEDGLLATMFDLSSTDGAFSGLIVGGVESFTVTHADGTVVDAAQSKMRFQLEPGETVQAEYRTWVIDDVPANSLVIRPATNSTDLCTLELGLS